MFNFKITDSQLVDKIIKIIIILFAVIVLEFFIKMLTSIGVLLVGIYCAFCVWTGRDVKL